MTPHDVLSSLFPDGHAVQVHGCVMSGHGTLPSGEILAVIGIVEAKPVGIEEAITLSRFVLDAIRARRDSAVLVVIDSGSQRMSKRDELLGLSEFLAHLATCLLYADLNGLPTIGLLYGHTAAGAFIASALATRVLAALPGATPTVMDLHSMSRVTKLPLEVLEEKAKSSPVFAPGLENLKHMGAVAQMLTLARPLPGQIQKLLARIRESDWLADERDLIGKVEGGRPKASDIAQRVQKAVRAKVA